MILGWPFCSHKKDPPKCEGYRCPIGKCISDDLVCDKKNDCHDGSDEDPKLCAEKNKCKPNELKCIDGKCVPKTKFCDGFSGNISINF